MSRIDIAVLVLAAELPALSIVRFVLVSRWLDRLDAGLPPEGELQLIGWWGPSENRKGLESMAGR